jgi:t-SNARE complex subunit (syntaxin)
MRELMATMDKSERKAADLDDLQSALKEYQIALDGFKIEIKGQSDANKAIYKKKFREHKADYGDLKNDIDWKRTQINKNELLGDAEGKQTDLSTGDGLMKHGLEVQESSKESLQRTLGKVTETTQIGRDTANKLSEQTKQLEGMHDTLEDIQTSLQRSTKIIKRMARKLASDKYIWCICFCVLAAIIFIIIYSQINKGSGTNVPSV